MSKLRKFLKDWNIGRSEVLTFIAMIMTIAICYIILIISSIIYTLN